MQSITPEQLKLRLEQGEQPVLLDVRDSWEFEICRIDGSQNIPMSEVPQQMSSLNKEAETIVICHHGMRSFQVGSYLENLGHTRIINLDGGIDLWAKTVDHDMPQY